MRVVRTVALVGAVALGACGDDGGSSKPELSESRKTEAYCAYFKAHRTQARQQLIGGLLDVAPKEIKDDLQAAYGMNEPGFESSKRVQAFTQEHCDDPAEELRTP